MCLQLLILQFSADQLSFESESYNKDVVFEFNNNYEVVYAYLVYDLKPGINPNKKIFLEVDTNEELIQ